MNVLGINQIDLTYNKQMASLLESDDVDEWAIRYVWVQRRENNDDFIANYFRKDIQDAASGKNLRNSTMHLANIWAVHNKIIGESAQNGSLIWRIKIFNEVENSIDYMEVWKSRSIIESLFLMDGNSANAEWNQKKSELAQGIYDAGFVTRIEVPIRCISRKFAAAQFKKFYEMSKQTNTIIINTPLTASI